MTGHNQNYRWENQEYSVNKIEIYVQQGSFGHKECRQGHNDP